MSSSIKAKQILLVGAPNSGKTTLYNWLTASNFRAVNYPGSTVEYCKGKLQSQWNIDMEIIDTPGIRSLEAHSPEEEISIRIMRESLKNNSAIVVVPVDATQLSRHLFLVSCLKAQGIPVIVALTMLDLLKQKNVKIDSKKLSQELKLPVLEIDGQLGGGVKELAVLADQSLNSSKYTEQIQNKKLSQQEIQNIYQDNDRIEKDCLISLGDESAKSEFRRAHQRSLKIDSLLMHPLLGLVFFIAIMSTLFSAIFWLAAPAMDFVDSLFGDMAGLASETLGSNIFSDFVANGIIAGSGAVFVFIPQIMILFFIMGLLEESGYLARAASLIDKPLQKIGMNGKSFVPILSGYACAIPAMMAARTIQNRKERLLTIFILPLMSCSARLPVFALLLGFLFPDDAFKAGFALAIIYLASIVIGAITAAIVNRFLPQKENSTFMLELPAYRRPKIMVIFKQMQQRTLSYVKRAGPTILVISVIIWALSTFPNYQAEDDASKISSSYLAQIGSWIEPTMKPLGGDWKLGVGILSAFAAREVFVSTMALVYRVEGETDEGITANLITQMHASNYSDASAYGLIVFFMIALQCLTTVAVAKAETGSTKFAVVQLVSFSLLAYIAAAAVVFILS